MSIKIVRGSGGAGAGGPESSATIRAVTGGSPPPAIHVGTDGGGFAYSGDGEAVIS